MFLNLSPTPKIALKGLKNAKIWPNWKQKDRAVFSKPKLIVYIDTFQNGFEPDLNFKFLQLQISSTSNFITSKFLQPQIHQLQMSSTTISSNFNFILHLLNFNFNFHCLQISSTSNCINFKYIHFQISSTKNFFNFKFQFHTSISNFDLKFL